MRGERALDIAINDMGLLRLTTIYTSRAPLGKYDAG